MGRFAILGMVTVGLLTTGLNFSLRLVGLLFFSVTTIKIGSKIVDNAVVNDEAENIRQARQKILELQVATQNKSTFWLCLEKRL